MARPDEFQRRMFEVYRERAVSLNSTVDVPEISDIKDSFKGDDIDLAQCLTGEVNRMSERLWNNQNLHRLTAAAKNMAMCYLLGMGTRVNEEQALHWLSIAALAGEGQSIYSYTSIEQSTRRTPASALPRKMWCAHGVLEGIRSDEDSLHDVDPALSKIARAMRQKGYWGRRKRCAKNIGPYLSQLMSRVRMEVNIVENEVEAVACLFAAHGEKVLHLCAAVGDLDDVKYLILKAKADINSTNN